MSLAVPTTAEIAENIVAQLESALEEGIPLLPKSFCHVLAKVLGGVFILLWKYAAFTLAQMFVQYATMRETDINGKTIRPLVEWGRLIGEGDPYAAVQAEHEISVDVINQTGTLPGGTQLIDPATGVIHLTTAPVTLNAATVTVTVRASSDRQGGDGAGDQGNLDEGAELSFVNPIPNVRTIATVDERTVDGVDAESEEDYRARVVLRFQRVPQGGAYADYQLWAQEPESILAAYPYTSDVPGEVDVYIEVVSDLHPDGLATTTEIEEAENAINLDEEGQATRRPAHAGVNVYSITRSAVDVTITGLSPSSGTLRTTIETAIDEHLRTLEPWIEGLSTGARHDRISKSAIAGVVHEVASANGASVDDVEVFESSATVQSRSLHDGEKAKIGLVSWQ